MNGVVALFTEVPTMTMQNIYNVGYVVLIANALVAFMLNVSVVFLVCPTVTGLTNFVLTCNRLERHLPWSSHSAVFSKISSSWLPA